MNAFYRRLLRRGEHVPRNDIVQAVDRLDTESIYYSGTTLMFISVVPGVGIHLPVFGSFSIDGSQEQGECV
jgi:hypothetical protein